MSKLFQTIIYFCFQSSSRELPPLLIFWKSFLQMSTGFQLSSPGTVKNSHITSHELSQCPQISPGFHKQKQNAKCRIWMFISAWACLQVHNRICDWRRKLRACDFSQWLWVYSCLILSQMGFWLQIEFFWFLAWNTHCGWSSVVWSKLWYPVSAVFGNTIRGSTQLESRVSPEIGNRV